jgi:hypothetical protein
MNGPEEYRIARLDVAGAAYSSPGPADARISGEIDRDRTAAIGPGAGKLLPPILPATHGCITDTRV